MLNPRRLVLALALAATVVAAACGSAASPAPSGTPTASATQAAPAPTPVPTPVATVATPIPAGPLVTILLRGGHCAVGSCEQTATIEKGGRVRLAAKPPNDLGIVGPMDLVTLQGAIASTDFNLLRTHPFTGECPVNYDGQELVLTFSTPNGDQVLAACTTALDFTWPVLAALTKALEPIWPLPHQG